MNTITIKYGIAKLTNKEVPEGTTYRSLTRDPSIRGALGFGESVNVVVDGQTVNLDDEVTDGETVLIEKRAASKA